MNKNLVFVILILFLAVLACGGSSGGNSQPAPPTVKKITYKVEGTGSAGISLTYNNEGGDTAQENARFGWSKSFDAKPGQFLYLSAQRSDAGSGVIRCIIEVDGQEFKKTESNGEFVIASCSGQTP